MQKDTRVFVFVGRSGSGKSTITKELSKIFESPIHISATTRDKRDGEQHGRDYYFVSEQEFFQQELLEYEQFGTAFYGTLQKQFEDILSQNKISFKVMEPKGARGLKEKYPQNVRLVYLDMPKEISHSILVHRDGDEKGTKRYLQDIENFDKYLLDSPISFDHVFLNNGKHLEGLLGEISSMIHSETK